MRILFVTLAQSVHAARWIDQLAGTGWDLHVFPVFHDVPPYPELKGVTLHDFFYGAPDLAAQVRHTGIRVTAPVIGQPLLRVARGAAHRLWPGNSVDRLVSVVKRIKPDIVHTMEFSSGGGLTLEAKKRLGDAFPPWIIGNWGDEVQFFSKLSAYGETIKAVVRTADYFTSECARDLPLVRELGFQGEVLPVTPAGGGFDLDQTRPLRQPGLTSARKWILIKGYQDIRGRALFALRALELCADQLAGYRVGVYAINSEEVRTMVELLQHKGLPIEIIPRLPTNNDILKLFGQARVYLGLSMSDGISTSLLQALVMGTFPIQSGTACANEWITHGESGMIVPPQDPQMVAEALQQALTDDALVDAAVAINDETTRTRLDKAIVSQNTIALYEQVMQQVQPTAMPGGQVQ
ncbi:MAG: glycosyltransferase [bacterium]|nr:glycosyltransferase [bacterium]